MIKTFFHLFFFLSFFNSLGQTIQLSPKAEVSIVTVGPGKELYEAFGHSAIRIKDSVLNLDLIYNYGIFDFNAPNFYSNFIKGKLLYKVAGYPFRYFKESYKQDKRWIKQQVLNLSQNQVQEFYDFLENNIKPKNATYFYDPYFNNCATKLRDVTKTVLRDKVIFNDAHLNENLSFRQLMNREIYWNTWGSFGINLALGSTLDRKINSEEYMYLPDYVFYAYKNANVLVQNQPKKMVRKEEIILDFEKIEQKSNMFSPLWTFVLIAFLGLWITYKDIKSNKRTKWFDFSLFLTTGFVGLFIVFLWFFTNHSTTPNNFNFLWAFAPNLLIAFFFLKKESPKWLQKYLILLLLFLITIPVIWFLEIQLFPISIIPLFVLFFIRYYYLKNRLLSFKK